MAAEHNRIDLHTHTSFSDGELEPAELFLRAREHEVSVLSITDHDTVAAYDDESTMAAAEAMDITLIPGVEISTADKLGRRFHILGLHVDTQHVELRSWLDRLADVRKNYAAEVGAKMHQAGWALDMDQLNQNRVISKAHIADLAVSDPANTPQLVHTFGRKPTRGQFIETMMNENGPFYAKRESGPTPEAAAEIIHAAGGIAVLAHPVAYLYEQELDFDDIEDCVVDAQLDGIEALYYYYSKSMGDRKVNRVKQFVALAEKLGVLVVGGSDFHGDNPLVGRFTDLGMPEETLVPNEKNLSDLAAAAAKYRS